MISEGSFHTEDWSKDAENFASLTGINIIFLYFQVESSYFKYKPDSQKVGTLYKLWIKKKCNNLQIS